MKQKRANHRNIGDTDLPLATGVRQGRRDSGGMNPLLVATR